MLFAVQVGPFSSNKQWDFEMIIVKDENKVVDVLTVIFKYDAFHIQ